MPEPAGKYLRDICPRCGGHLIEKDGMHFFDIAEAIMFMICENCGQETVDIGLSRNYIWKQRFLKEKKEKELEKRKMTLF